MPKTTVYFPRSVLEGLSRIAEERGISRSQLIVESCRRIVEQRTSWPDHFFTNDHLSETDLQLLRTSEDDSLDAILGARKSRTRQPFRRCP